MSTFRGLRGIYQTPVRMFAESRPFARGALQLLSLLRRLNTCSGQGKIEVFSSENVQNSSVFSLENRRGFSSNCSLPRSLVPLHLQRGLRSFSAISQESRDEDFSELDAKEMNEDEGFKDAITKKVPSLTSLFSNKYKMKSVKTVASIFPEKNEKKSVKSVTSIFPEKNEKKSVKSVTSNYTDQNEKKSVKSVTPIFPEKNEKKSVKSVTSNYSDQNEKKSVKSVTSISSKITEKKNVKSEQQQEKMPKTERKAEGVSDIVDHPWPEWVRFIEHLNETGHLSKAFHFQGPIELQGLSTEGIYAFIEFAAFGFAKDRVEISKLSGSDLKKVALYCCPSVERKVVFAAERLHSFYSTEDDAFLHSNMAATSNPPSVESEVKRLELEDVVRLLCAYGLNAEKSELPIPDDIKQSVVNLLKELVDISTSSVIDG